MSATPASQPKRDRLYLQVLVAIALGVAVGRLAPDVGKELKILGEVFVKMIKALIGPIVFCTVASGIAGAGDLKRVGRVGAKALLYFEVMTTIALMLGLGIVHVWRPGEGMHVDPATLSGERLSAQTSAAGHRTWVDHLVAVVPDSLVSAFTSGEILQVLFVATLFGLATTSLGVRGDRMKNALEATSEVLFKIIGMLMRLAPIGAFGAMAYTVAQLGLESLANLVRLMLGFYATALAFVFLVLGAVCRVVGVSIVRLLAYLKEELLIVLGTSSSESVLPRVMDRLEHLGCSPAIVRLVIPTGYSFNLDGTSIYLTMAALFVAQALDVHLTWGDELALLGVLLLTSKGAAAVTGGGFVTLAATLESTHTIPVVGLTLLLGIDRFMSECRALTNLVGNSVATLVVSAWEGGLDLGRARRVLAGETVEPLGGTPDES
jgi:aerobic C4-dicarboxylate transport protein